ncbi:MAG: large subunit ribosomal protein [Pseudonocardia sp.]
MSAHRAPAGLSARASPTPTAGTNRRWDPNIQSKRYWLAGKNRYVRLRLSAKGIKTVDKSGVEAAVARLRARGERV